MVLIVALVILVLITLVGLSTIRTTTMEEKMAGNSRDRDRAFQAAEAAVQRCLELVNAGSFSPILPPVAASGVAAPQHWEVTSNWTMGSTTSVTPGGLTSDPNLAEPPRCIVESLDPVNTPPRSYRVTGRALGGSPDTVVILQATYSVE